MTGFTELLRHTIRTRSPRDVAWRYNAKVDGRALAESLGVPVPTLIDGPKSILKMRPLVDRGFVVKPNKGHSARGVLALVPFGDGWYRNLVTPLTKPQTWGKWREAALSSKKLPSETRADRVKAPWLMEELIGDGITTPDEWKFFGFADGSVPVVRQRKIRADGVSVNRFWEVWDTTLIPIDGSIESRREIDETLEPPPSEMAALMIRYASMIARAASRPFARIDFLVDQFGQPYFGEVTPEPSAGRREIYGEWDRILGRHWLKAMS